VVDDIEAAPGALGRPHTHRGFTWLAATHLRSALWR
jgi:hypothetical protein